MRERRVPARGHLDVVEEHKVHGEDLVQGKSGLAGLLIYRKGLDNGSEISEELVRLGATDLIWYYADLYGWGGAQFFHYHNFFLEGLIFVSEDNVRRSKCPF